MKISYAITKSPEFHCSSIQQYFARKNPETISRRDRLNEMIESGEISFEEVPCLCGDGIFSLIANYDKFGIKQKVVICNHCGLIQSNPRMTEEATDWFYSSDFYDNLYGRIVGKDLINFITAESNRRPLKRYEFIKKHTDYEKVNSVLEIGCAGGWNLYPFFKDGKKTVGYDYGPTFVTAGRKLGIDLRIGKVENDKKAFYDIIILCQVIEHFLNPIETIKSLQKHLSPGGYFYIETPNLKNLTAHSFVNAHTYYFTEKTFLHYLGKAGLAPVTYSESFNDSDSQAGLFKVQKTNGIPNLGGEFERMKAIIIRADKKINHRRKIKNFLQKTGLGNFSKIISRSLKTVIFS